MWVKVNSLDINPNSSWKHCEWNCKILKNIENEFIAELWILDEYDDYLMQWKIYQTSPVFKTEVEAKEYVLNYWDKEEEI